MILLWKLFCSVIDPIIFPLESKFPYLTSSEKEIGRLEIENKLLRRKYASLVVAISDSFEERSINPDMIKSILSKLHIRQSVDITEIFLSASDYWSFFNYEILEDLINKLGNDSDRIGLTAYISEFNKYCQRGLCEVPIDVLKSDRKMMSSLHIKTDKRPDVCLKDIKLLQLELCELLSCKHLLLVDVGGICIGLAFDYLEENLHLSGDYIHKLVKLGITRMYTDEQVLYDHEKVLHDQSSKSLKYVIELGMNICSTFSCLY